MKIKFAGLILLFLFYFPLTLFAGNPLVFSGLQRSTLGRMVEEILIEAYDSIGIQVKIKRLPGQRALNLANEGGVDGAELRVATIRNRYKNLLMVPVPVYITKIKVFTKGLSFKVEGWESLRGLRIAAPAGYTAILDHLQGFKYWAVSYVQIFNMLNTGRVDVGIVDHFNGLITVKKLGMGQIKPLEPHLKEIQFFHFLHKKHYVLLPAITRTLRKMEREGRLKAIWEKYEKQYAE